MLLVNITDTHMAIALTKPTDGQVQTGKNSEPQILITRWLQC